MKFILDVEESKATMLIEFLNDLPYVEVRPLHENEEKMVVNSMQL